MSKRAIALVVGVLALLGAPAEAAAQAEPAKKERGYITLPDGKGLRYTLYLPEGDGPFPTLMQYEGYQAGSNPARATHEDFIPNMLAKGYAVIGVSVRGSACSDGTWEIFSEQQARDGAFALEWAAQQPWSNGRVGLFGYSYGGIMQLWVASLRPKGLVATAPGNTVADTYRDISYPGGIVNIVFPSVWGVALQTDWVLAGAQAAQEGDARCLVNWPLNHARTDSVAKELLTHPFDDQWHHDHSAANLTPNIDVPVLGVRTWQDEETGSRQADFWSQLDPRRTWLVNSNGNHLVYQSSDDFVPMLEGFFDHFVKGEANGFRRTPRAQVWHETGLDSDPRTVTTQPRLPVKVARTQLFLGAGGVLSDAAGADGASTYKYPVAAPPVTDTSSQGLQEDLNASTWTVAPHLDAGRAVFTTPPLARTLTTYGPASADLYVSTTAPDVDLQVTVTEVRPDGQEVYVQRGWLRASHRALDAPRSTAYAPYHPHTQASLQEMPAGEPQLLRVEVFPFGHTFRTGSSLRIYVEEPSLTGLWGFQPITASQDVSIHYGAGTPSKLVLGRLPKANVAPDLPACGTLLNQACRPNPVPQPEGSLDLAGSRPASLRARVRARRARVRVRLHARGGSVRPVNVMLRRGGRTLARTRLQSIGRTPRRVVLGRRLAPGAYRVVVRSRGATLLRRAVRIKRASGSSAGR